MSADNLGDRMKLYETVPRIRLVPKVPVLMRIDGKAFHTLTHGMDKPMDRGFVKCMLAAATELCEQIQGCQFAYTWSDEIQLLLIDYQSIKTQGWFEYDLQKMCSVGASIATLAFARAFDGWFPDRASGAKISFDCRAWNLPREEVTNCFIWRQQDASRNSVSALAQAHFSHKQLQGNNGSQMQDMLMLEKGINWNDCPVPQKRGLCVVREAYQVTGPDGQPAERHRWAVDENIPIFTQDRDYVERFVRHTAPGAKGAR